MAKQDLAQLIGMCMVDEQSAERYISDPKFWAETFDLKVTAKEAEFFKLAGVKEAIKECAKKCHCDYGPDGKGTR